MKYYKGNDTGGTPGILPDGYFRYEAVSMFGHLIDYWYYTGDTQYNDVISQAMLFQVGPNNDYMPPNQTDTEGNDDQLFWAFAALSAAENKFPDPPSDQPQWLALAQAVFNEQALKRWDNTTCGGGMRWQINSWSGGYTYKSAIANGGLFMLAARLARYTGNSTYADWANTVWNWSAGSPLMTSDFTIFDGTTTTNNCSDASHELWTYNQGAYLLGAATMYNFTNGNAVWENRTAGLLAKTGPYFSQAAATKDVMTEITCEPSKSCDTDQKQFKGFLSRWMAVTTQFAPFTATTIIPLLQASGNAASKSCSGGTDGVTCGVSWLPLSWDGSYGVGEQMSALAIIQANLIQQAPALVTTNTGGSSKGNPTAGNLGNSPQAPPTVAVTTSDRGGAWTLTVLYILALLAGIYWLVT